jgi:cytochrome c556
MVRTSMAFLAAVAVGVSLGACNKESTEKPAAASSAAPVVAAAPAPKPPFSVNEMMVMIVDQPGELLWDIEKPGHAPKTAEDWYQLEDHAVSLAGAATLIQLGGTGFNDNNWAATPEWRTSAQNLVAAALKARAAAKAKSMDALVAANGQIVDACEACHAKFKPDIPTGGLFIHKRPGLDPGA